MNKQIILTIILATLTINAVAQSVDSIYIMDKTMLSITGKRTNPEFPGGKKGLMKFLSKNVTYPKEAASYDVEGSVIMVFIINEDGTLSEISAHECKIDRFNTTKFSQETEQKQKQLKEHFALLFAKEGARVIRKMPKWKPGMLNGKATRVKISQPISFSMPSK